MKEGLQAEERTLSVIWDGQVRLRGLHVQGHTTAGVFSAVDPPSSPRVREDRGKAVVKTETREGEDDLGSYTSLSQRFLREKVGSGRLELRYYPALRVVTGQAAVAAYQGDLLSEGGARVESADLPGLARLLGGYLYSDWWARPTFSPDLANLPARTQFLLWQTEDGSYGCLVPLVSGQTKAEVNGRTGRLGVDLTTHDAGRRKVDSLCFVLGWGEDPFELVRRVYTAGMTAAGRPGHLRWEKPFPVPFEYLGWCSWDAFYQQVNEAGLREKMEEFRQKEVPVRFVLIDDGWSPTPQRQLAGFGTDKEKFPQGLRPIVRAMKEEYGVKYVGVWHTFNGYWGGIHPESPLAARYRSHLLESKQGHLLPAPDLSAGVQFWSDWHAHLRAEGIDFVKVDNQGCLYHHTRHLLPIGTAASGAQYALQASVNLHLRGWMINCMCMTSEAHWHWITSNVSRSSEDFWPRREGTAAEHARQNVYNSLWYGNLCWPDWDMWWTEHPQATYHAVLRALSGGPVYFSDEVGRTRPEVLWPLILSDGRLLRCDQPGLPTRDCLFADPQHHPIALKVWNRVGTAGLVAAFHATESEEPVSAAVRPADVEGLEGETFAVREHFSGETRLLARDEAWEWELEQFGVRLFVVVPVEKGFAALGLTEKYVAPRTVTAVRRWGETIEVDLAEGGTFLAYCARPVREVRAEGETVPFAYAASWLRVDCPGRPALTLCIF
ncbi:MAG TPA: hypothetical protein EYP85_11545 [Armatimonadetes bacterium]|nr:hypothetical protein [Armatimonadota bacterium]